MELASNSAYYALELTGLIQDRGMKTKDSVNGSLSPIPLFSGPFWAEIERLHPVLFECFAFFAGTPLFKNACEFGYRHFISSNTSRNCSAILPGPWLWLTSRADALNLARSSGDS